MTGRWRLSELGPKAGDLAVSTRDAAVARPWLAALAGVAVIGVAVLAWRLLRSPPPPPPNDPVALAQFIASSDFEKLPAEQKRPYMKLARRQMRQIETLRREEKIDKRSYRLTYVAAWMERRLDDMDDYFKQPPDKRAAWLDRQMAEKETRSDKDRSAGKAGAPAKENDPRPPVAAARPSASTRSGAAGAGAVKTSSIFDDDDETKLLYDDEPSRVKFEEMKDDFEDEFLDTWTANRKQLWEQFRAAYKQRREARERASTRPSAGTR